MAVTLAETTCLIDRLPVETLSHIFIEGLSPSDGPWFDGFCDPSQYRNLLGSICHRWRNISHSTPELWTNIMVICPPDASSAVLRARRERLAQVLARSGRLVLDVSFHHYGSPAHAPALGMFLEHIHRIRSFYISFYDNSFWGAFLPLPPISGVKKLTLSKDLECSYPDHIKITSDNTTLHELVLDGDPNYMTSISVKSLKSLTLNCDNAFWLFSVADLIRRHPELESLEIYSPWIYGLENRSLTSTSLTLLSITCSRPSFTPIFPSLTGLKHLYLKFPSQDTPQIIDDASASLPSLKSLAVGGVIGTHMLSLLLSSAPNLLALELRSSVFEVHVERAFASNESPVEELWGSDVRLIRVVARHGRPPENFLRAGVLYGFMERIMKKRPQLQIEWYGAFMFESQDSPPRPFTVLPELAKATTYVEPLLGKVVDGMESELE